jgi:hypothetical protein
MRKLIPVLLLVPLAANADLIGDEIFVQQFFPDRTTLCEDTAGFGTSTWTFEVTGDDSDEFISCGRGVNVNVQGDSVLVTKNNDSRFGRADFSGFVFSDLDWLPGGGQLVDVVLTDPVTTPVNDLFVIDDSSFGFELQGLFWASGSVAEFRLIFETGPTSSVPEPGALGLLGFGLIATGAARRRKRA